MKSAQDADKRKTNLYRKEISKKKVFNDIREEDRPGNSRAE